MATTSHIQNHVQYLANAARVAVELGGLAPGRALDMVARNAQAEATLARTRGGRWAQESTTAAIDEALFAGSVARDILDGAVFRPSTGNVRNYALGVLQAVLADQPVEVG